MRMNGSMQSTLNYTGANMNLDEICDGKLQLIDTIFFFMCIVVVVIGVFGNSASVIILIWARCRAVSSLNIYLICVYVCDLGFLLSLSLQLAKIGRVALNTTTSVSCEVALYVVNVLSFVSQWSMWAISVERFLAVCHPMSIKYRRFTSVQSAANVVLTLLVTAMALEIWVFFIVETLEDGECDVRTGASLLFDIFNLIDSFVSYAVPGVMIAYFTFSIFHALRDRQSTFRELDPSALRTDTSNRNGRSYETIVVISKGASERAHRRERQAAWFLMVVVLSDTFLNVQNYTLRLFNTFYTPDPTYCLLYRSIQVISYVLYYCQFSANIFYLIFCPGTRHFVTGRKSSRMESVSGADIVRKKSSDSSYHHRVKMSSPHSPNNAQSTMNDITNAALIPLLPCPSRSPSTITALETDDL